jgi:hypothetical protein
MSDKPKKSASDLKLMIEKRLLAIYPECERAEVVINPPIAGRPWSACIFGTVDQKCRRAIEDIAAQLREQFELVI